MATKKKDTKKKVTGEKNLDVVEEFINNNVGKTVTEIKEKKKYVKKKNTAAKEIVNETIEKPVEEHSVTDSDTINNAVNIDLTVNLLDSVGADSVDFETVLDNSNTSCEPDVLVGEMENEIKKTESSEPNEIKSEEDKPQKVKPKTIVFKRRVVTSSMGLNYD